MVSRQGERVGSFIMHCGEHAKGGGGVRHFLYVLHVVSNLACILRYHMKTTPHLSSFPISGCQVPIFFYFFLFFYPVPIFSYFYKKTFYFSYFLGVGAN